MANIGKYKAAASTSAKYTRGLGKVQETGYDRAWNEQQGEQQRAMYGAIGSTVQNIVGIMDEKKKQSEMTKFKDIAAGLEGIETREEQYQPLGTVGGLLGLKSKTKKSYFAKESGAELTESVMGALGMKKAYTGETDYDISPEGWVSPVSPEGKIREAQKGIVPGEGPYNKETKERMDAAAADDMTAEFERRKLRAEQIESDQVVVSEEASDPEYSTAESGGLLDNIGKKVGDTTVYDEETRTATTTVADDSAYRIAGKSDAVDRGDIIEESDPLYSQGLDTDYTKKEMAGFKKDRQMDYPGPGIKEQTFEADKKERAQEQRDQRISKTGEAIDVVEAAQSVDAFKPSKEDSVTDEMSKPDKFSLEGASVKDVKQQLHGINPERAQELSVVMGIESTWGSDPAAKGNPFQLKGSRAETAKKEGIDIGNMEQVANFYTTQVDSMTKDFGEYELEGDVQFLAQKGKTVNVFQMMSEHGLDENMTKYLTWQQGRGGMLDIITASKSGNIGRGTINNMLSNVHNWQEKKMQDILDEDTKNETGRNRRLVSMFLKFQKQNAEKKGYKFKPNHEAHGRAQYGGDLYVSQSQEARKQQRKDNPLEYYP